MYFEVKAFSQAVGGGIWTVTFRGLDALQQAAEYEAVQAAEVLAKADEELEEAVLEYEAKREDRRREHYCPIPNAV